MEIQQTTVVTREQIWKKLEPINVNAHIEIAGRLKFLTWSKAIGILNEHFPNNKHVFEDDKTFADGSMEVSVLLDIEGHIYRMWLPVMNHMHKAIPNPSATDVNKARMRCLTKAIAMAGLGYYIYSGEDLPQTTTTMAGGLPTENTSPDDGVTATVSQPSPIKSTDDIMNTIIPVGKAKGKPYGEIFTDNNMVSDAVKYWTGHAKNIDQKNHLENLKALRVVMALEVKGVA